MVKSYVFTKYLSILFFLLLINSCGNSTKDNFDFTDFKIPNKATGKIKNPDSSDSSKTKYKITKNQLISYQNKSEILDSVILGKIDPFSEEGIKVNNWSSDFQLTGFLTTKINKYVLVKYLGNEGTISEESIGGTNTFLLPNGARVINIDPKNLKLTINFENEDYIFEF